MKYIKEYAWYKVDGKDILIVGNGYNGSPIVMWKYDVLIGPKRVIDRYKEELIPRRFKGHKVNIKYL